jgi:hypothetical protein
MGVLDMLVKNLVETNYEALPSDVVEAKLLTSSRKTDEASA